MGLTKNSVGKKAADSFFACEHDENTKVIALAGNPNVGKSTVFNALTGMNQHTGNWPGKTVANARGHCRSERFDFELVDIPGTYSLMAHSAEEQVARDFICFGGCDAVVVVCDATCLERNLNLVFQIMEVTENVIVCVNLMDEAKRKGIEVDISKLSELLGVPVVATAARRKKSLSSLIKVLDEVCAGRLEMHPAEVKYPSEVVSAAAEAEKLISADSAGIKRGMALKFLEGDEELTQQIFNRYGIENAPLPVISDADALRDMIVEAITERAQAAAGKCVRQKGKGYASADGRIDKVLTGKHTAYPLMLLFLVLIFWLTITGANYPSELLGKGLFWVQDRLSELFMALGAPDWLHGVLVLGVYRTLAWVVSVMLPPMAIFFPLFTLLEDVGYLPRIAYNLDKPFKKCSACGKQALTMCMGFGCNAAGIVGCRIIDSPRERMLAMLTNSFVPCNGRFPMLITIISMFFVISGSTAEAFLPALLMTAVIIFSVFMTFAATKLLSKTVLRGMPSSFTLEMPPYRPPQVGKIIVRSIVDRTLFVLGRAATVAAPAGMLIWLFANINVGDASILAHCANFLDPVGRLMGMDGIILLAFILGFPANEIVVPIMIMGYLSRGSLMELASVETLRQVFIANGWTWITALNVMLFSLMHWPCSTTLMTIKKESGSIKYTLAAALLPTAFGVVCCMLTTLIAGFFQ